MDQGVPEGTYSQVLRSTRLICSVLRASNLPCLKFIEIVKLLVKYTIPFGVTFLTLFGIKSHILNYFVRIWITDEGSVPEMQYGPYYNLIRFTMVYKS